ncbi:hypothetical protein [Sphingomonas sp. 8AM]|uniref:hypothetical protein n=1 Tax=Sphingomonas sp. 8AM TaxID=2653170 RepID=UPI0012F1B30F|nr:hypothetical protein [Sphingomonas sp. 8AM]VXC80154.1 hypothetical protein SPHINGO8AM_220025 [Sphingomonas sp. 8AM]
MLGHYHRPHDAASCRHCHGTNRIAVSRPIGAGRRRVYNVPCNVVTRAQADADRARAGRWIGWTAFAAASLTAGVLIEPVATMAAAVLR